MEQLNELKRTAAVLIAAACPMFASVYAEEAEGNSDDAAVVSAPAPAKVQYFTLVNCSRIEAGKVQVMKPGATDWTNAEEDTYYPVGTRVAAHTNFGKKPNAEFALAANCKLLIKDDCEFTLLADLKPNQRGVQLASGTLQVVLPPNMQDGCFTVRAPFFTAKNMVGESIFVCTPKDDGCEATVHCVTGSMALDGMHWRVARMAAADNIALRSGEDALFTSLRGLSGDCKVTLDKGIIVQQDLDSGNDKEAPITLDFALSPKCAIKIFRMKSAASGNMAVSMMTFNAKGEMKNRFTFAENRPNMTFDDTKLTEADLEANNKKAEELAAATTEAVEVKSDDAEQKDDAE